MHRKLDRFRPHGGVTSYSCVDVITVLRKSLKDVVGYKNVRLTKSLRLLVLGQGLCLELVYGSILAVSCSIACSLVGLFFLSSPPSCVCRLFYVLAGCDMPRTGRRGHKFQDAVAEKGVIISSG